jgi:hypothetical protein
MNDHEIIYLNLSFVDSTHLENFLQDFKRIEKKRGNEPLTDEESDIIEYSLVKPENFVIQQVNGEKLKIKPILDENGRTTLYGDNSWIPFIAKYLIGEFHVKERWDDVWGAKLNGDGTYQKLISEIRMVEE